jgi:hypothetical protein
LFWIPGTSYKGPLPELKEADYMLAKSLRSHVEMLAGDIGARSLTSAPANLEIAAGYIEHQFQLSGADVSSQFFEVDLLSEKNRVISADAINFPATTHSTRNIVCEVRGGKRSSEIVVIGAHYDSVYDCPAANDNGSGVAALLELAKLAADWKPQRTLRFVAFTNEEPPFFHTDKMGSFQYAKRCSELKENVAAMLSLETIGYYTQEPGSQTYPHALFKTFCPDRGNFLLFVSNLRSHRLLTETVSAFRSGVKFPSEAMALPESITGVTFSDQDSFWKFGYPALMVTDTANFRYPHYHASQDTPDKLDYENLARVMTGLVSVLRKLAVC